jgi:alanine racemase
VEVDLDAVAHNVAEIKRVTGAECALYAALKCDAYGFGLVPVAHTLEEAGAEAMAVARIGDALVLRDAGLRSPLLLYGGPLVTSGLVSAVERLALIPTILDLESAAELSRRLDREVPVFVKVDVGQRRLGAEPTALVPFARAVARLPRLRVEGLYTHFSVPPDPVPEGRIERQFALFEECLRDLDAAGVEVRVRMAASSGVLRLSDRMSLNAVDPGRMLFGLVPGGRGLAELRCVLRSFRTRLLQVKVVEDDSRRPDPPAPVAAGMRLGVIPLGTGDGLALASAGEVLVRGMRAPLVEPIPLEHCRIDLSGVPAAAAGDEVVVIGRQGGEEITIDEVVARRAPAAKRHTVPIDIRESVARVYVD